LDKEIYQQLIYNNERERIPLKCFFGDGELIDVLTLNHIREVMKNEMIIFPLKAGDVLILDNLLIAHGRMPFASERKIILAMT
jgi:hypothetical protein